MPAVWTRLTKQDYDNIKEGNDSDGLGIMNNQKKKILKIAMMMDMKMDKSIHSIVKGILHVKNMDIIHTRMDS
ncbi:MAG: hypothetical protein ACM3X1_05160 [Ignavibacteriales bacterium]